MEKKIRSLKPEEIEIRVQQVTEKGAQLLLYKDSRCDKRILDETFGIFGWKNKYEEIKGNLFCTISIYDHEKQQWIDKCDCGVESNGTDGSEKKGEASDSFKRAGFNVGIGRELYTRIFYFAKVPTKQNGTDKKGNPKYELVNRFEKFTVAEMSTNEETEKIEKIKIADSKGNIVFSYGYLKTTAKKEEIKKMDKPVEMIEEGQVTAIRILLKDHEELKTAVYKKLGITSSTEMPSKLTKAQGTSLIKQLKSKVGE
jgi:hypothetical protein